MKNLRKDIGNRLKEIRLKIFNEGVKLSANQFAQLIASTKDKIINYENGRSNVPVELLVKLYYKGINPVYILTGEGNVFADNQAGITLRQRINVGKQFSSDVQVIGRYQPREFDPESLTEEDKLTLIRAVAGDILKSRKKDDQ